MNEDQTTIAGLFRYRGILYMPALSIAFNSIPAGILLSQLLYWSDKGHRADGWFYKTSHELYWETGLKRSGQETAIKKLLEDGVIEYKLAGIPAKRHFRVDVDCLYEILTSMQETDKLEGIELANSND